MFGDLPDYGKGRTLVGPKLLQINVYAVVVPSCNAGSKLLD